jgi:hypothetical protein
MIFLAHVMVLGTAITFLSGHYVDIKYDMPDGATNLECFVLPSPS